MTIQIELLLLLLWTHFVADFVAQTDSMAKNKSKSWPHLAWHVVVYSTFFLVLLFDFSPAVVSQYILVNFWLHFITDAISSRISSRMHEEKRIHAFFVVVGFDQFVHYVCLIGTAVWLLK